MFNCSTLFNSCSTFLGAQLSTNNSVSGGMFQIDLMVEKIMLIGVGVGVHLGFS